jgi:Zn-dependent protease with chaperone function
MSEEQIQIMRRQIEKLTKQANLTKTPTLKISKKSGLAWASARDHMIWVSAKLLSSWSEGEIDEDDVECILAHEIGHIIDLDRIMTSAKSRSAIVSFLYFVPPIPSFLMLAAALSLWVLDLWVLWLPLLIIMVIVWAFLVPYVFRWVKVTPEFEADRNALRMIKDARRLANTTAKRTAVDYVHAPRDFSPFDIWRRFCNVVGGPTTAERLQNLGFEIEKCDMKVRRISESSQHV